MSAGKGGGAAVLAGRPWVPGGDASKLLSWSRSVAIEGKPRAHRRHFGIGAALSFFFFFFLIISPMDGHATRANKQIMQSRPCVQRGNTSARPFNPLVASRTVGRSAIVLYCCSSFLKNVLLVGEKRLNFLTLRSQKREILI